MFSAIAPDVSTALRADLDRVAALSPFFAEAAGANPVLLSEILADIDVAYDVDALSGRYRSFAATHAESGVDSMLQTLRAREMLRIIFRDLTRRADLISTTAELSCLADFCVANALDHAYRLNVEKYGQPVFEDGRPMQMIVLAMGKLGARELNLSSDIDLVFLYPAAGTLETAAGKELSYQEFFIRTARMLISSLDDADAMGNVFRVDMRLRP